MADATTPMMLQYSRLKLDHKDAILFFRLGDFYEMFEDDAREASRILDLTLTKRANVPMCGIPYHAAGSYIQRLIKAGKKIAVCEQTAMPAGGKGLATREVVQVITPGTLVDEGLLEQSANNYLVSITSLHKRISLGSCDLSTGRFSVTSFPVEEREQRLRCELYRLCPREVVMDESLWETDTCLQRLVLERGDLLVNRFPSWYFDPASAWTRLVRQLDVVTLAGWGLTEKSAEVPAAGAVLQYIEDTAKNMLPHIKNLVVYSEHNHLMLDESTQRNLELVGNLQDGSRRYTLYEVLNHTKTAMGSRRLYEWITSPLLDRDRITARHDCVNFFFRDQRALSQVREKLSGILDIERLSSRIAMDRAHPKDLVSLKLSLQAVARIAQVLADKKDLPGFDDLAGAGETEIGEITALIEQAIDDDPSILLSEGVIIRSGYNGELDALRALRDNSQGVLENYLEEERKRTGISSLKLRYNRIIGYFLEVSKSNLQHVPENWSRRQSLVGGERFTTQVLVDRETEINNASERIMELQKELFLDVRNRVKAKVPILHSLARATGRLDVLQSFARAATISGYARPRMMEHSSLVIKRARHPVVEANLPGGGFVPNGIRLDPAECSFVLLTGPNMAGKSTYLRQTALVTLMAQIGSFVPAEDAEIGIVDKIFCRVGSSDNIARGESTFLSEMNETAHILRQATPRSLIIMDEVGRGTSTTDGLAIAWAVCLYILEKVKSKTLFATHFHELSAIAHPRLANYSMQVAERDGSIVFLKTVGEGPADSSYGIHVARLAGLPHEVIQAAYQYQETLINTGNKPDENKPQPDPGTPADKPKIIQPSLFSKPEMVLEQIRNLKIDEMKPVEALALLASLQEELKNQFF